MVLELSGIPPERKAHDVTKGERRRLLETLKGLTIPVKGPRPIAEAIVTSGGIKVGEIDPKTMASKKAPGLFLAGELIDSGRALETLEKLIAASNLPEEAET